MEQDKGQLAVANGSLALGFTLSAAALALSACVAAFLYQAIPWVHFPADLLAWSEPGFLGTIIKLTQGVPIYGPPGDNNSVVYTPGAPVVTYAILKMLGAATTIANLRYVQVAFVLLAAVTALCSARVIRSLVSDRPLRLAPLWYVMGGLAMFLAATSPRVNRLVFTLHTDAQVLFVAIANWLCLAWYVKSPSIWRLVPLAMLPAVGFFIKQFMIVWIFVCALAIALLRYEDHRRRAITTALYLALAAMFAGTVIVACSWVFGEHFRFWVFEILGGERRKITLAGEHNVALLRSLDHVLRVWWELAVGAVASWWLLHRFADQRLVALVAAWLALIGFQALTSGQAFQVLYHFGPAALIGASLWLAAMTVWAESFSAPPLFANRASVIPRAVAFLAIVLSFCSAMRVIPTRDPNDPRWFPRRVPSPELLAQVARIEQEAAGLDPATVLVDHGNWIYLPSGHIALDRAEALGDQPSIGRYENFEPLLERIRARHYVKIMVRALHRDTFVYDWWRWPRPSGVRQALLEHYVEIERLPAATGVPGMYDEEVSILIPRPIVN